MHILPVSYVDCVRWYALVFSVTATVIFLKMGGGEGTPIIAFDLDLNVGRSSVGLVVRTQRG